MSEIDWDAPMPPAAHRIIREAAARIKAVESERDTLREQLRHWKAKHDERYAECIVAESESAAWKLKWEMAEEAWQEKAEQLRLAHEALRRHWRAGVHPSGFKPNWEAELGPPWKDEAQAEATGLSEQLRELRVYVLTLKAAQAACPHYGAREETVCDDCGAILSPVATAPPDAKE